MDIYIYICVCMCIHICVYVHIHVEIQLHATRGDELLATVEASVWRPPPSDDVSTSQQPFNGHRESHCSRYWNIAAKLPTWALGLGPETSSEYIPTNWCIGLVRSIWTSIVSDITITAEYPKLLGSRAACTSRRSRS